MLPKGIPMLRPVILACVLTPVLPTGAGTASSQFSIQVTVAPTAERCSSETHSQTAAAVVQVVCDSGSFVNIAPGPGTIVGPQSTFFRYYIENVSAVRAGATDPAIGLLPQGIAFAELQQSIGTVTGLRVVAESGADNRYELLISF
jgi:hypothetical protein